jgi:hypothetical protein
LELLEDRRLLSITVTTLVDESDGSIADGDISLRDAIAAAPSGETINFAVTGTINLTLGELIIQRNLTINGPGADLLTIDASGSDGSRVIEIDDGNSETLVNIAISGLTLTGGDVSDGGGAIQSSENLTVTASTISGNSADKGGGIYSYSGAVTVSDSVISGNVGGGIFNYGDGDVTVAATTISGNSAESGGGIYGYNGSVTVTNSAISGNSASGSGGGIYAPHVTVTGSTISGNSAGAGAGIYGGYVSVTNSTISGNSAADRGGGIYNYGDMTVTASTISGNWADTGGGIYSSTDLTGVRTTVQNSTISGNISSSSGGGLFNYNGLTVIEFSTITLNEAPAGAGSGVASYGDSFTRTRVSSSIIAGNVGSDVDFVFGGTNSFLSNGYNLVGTGNALSRFNQSGDQTGSADPLLGPLAPNGGATKTHALLTGSPAIDRGNPVAVAGSGGVPAFDQRGTPHVRLHDGDGTAGARIDIGAFELQPLATPTLPGDYNASGTVDAADYVFWRNTRGTCVSAYSGADGSGNGVVDQADHEVWKANFGNSLPAPSAGSSANTVTALREDMRPTQTARVQPTVTSRVVPRSSLLAPVTTLPSDAVFTTLGQRKPAVRSTAVARTALRDAAVDTALSDSLSLLQLHPDGATRAEVSAQGLYSSANDADSEREWTFHEKFTWRLAAPELQDGRLLHRLAAFSIALLVLAPSAVRAVPLRVFETSLPGTSATLRPELAGTVLEDVIQPYAFAGRSGTVQNRVVRSDVDGTLDFYWRIVPTPNPIPDPTTQNGRIFAFRVTGFGNYHLDGDWRADDLGNVPPHVAYYFGGGSVNFLFDPGVHAGEGSRFFFLDTQAIAYAKVGQYDLLGGPSGLISPLFNTFVPVPEPTASVIMVMAALGLVLTFTRLERRCAIVHRGLVIMGIVLIGPADPASAAMYSAGTVAELIAAIDAANQNDEPDSINLAAGTTFTLTEVHNTLNGPTGLPIVTSGQSLRVFGNGGIIERSADDGTPAFRLFDVAAGTSLALENLTLQGGSAFDVANFFKNVGGAIYNAGNLTLTGVTVQHNIAQGRPGSSCIRCDRGTVGGPGWSGHGGGIYSAGSLLLENSTLYDNEAVGGRGGFASDGGGRGGDGRGGGLFVAAGTATLRGSIVTGNAARRGAGGAGYRDAPNGAPGQGIGGGIYIIADTQVALDEFTLAHVTGNTASTSNPNIFGTYAIIPNPTPLVGDYNGSGTVDAADYVVWRKGLGTVHTQSDYNAWRAHFGQTTGSGATAGAIVPVPEPAALLMLVSAMSAGFLANARQRYTRTHN